MGNICCGYTKYFVRSISALLNIAECVKTFVEGKETKFKDLRKIDKSMIFRDSVSGYWAKIGKAESFGSLIIVNSSFILLNYDQ